MMVAVLLCVTGGGAYLGSVVVARHRAQAAADLAALAAAARVSAGADVACARPRGGPSDAAGDLECAVQGLDVVVTVGAAVVGGRRPGRRPVRARRHGRVNDGVRSAGVVTGAR
ncbi:flp pilus-assembly TadE/G-like family protein [Mycobacterium xenopi 4042]|uniref:Flp pilus-assembly TadE/G-like family protein n=1 Tax=Mycobacterium xenopi 4042 TaxID=1299334 RepID=X8BCD6_MYCXE|nr:flp pilus-assembly TadE/G-like family protein [Mycobacterium xenopi 4042]